jgi:hypothetical protein
MSGYSSSLDLAGEGAERSLTLDLSPDSMTMSRFFRPSFLARKAGILLFAAPSTGGAASLTRNSPAPFQPTTSSLREEGWTRIRNPTLPSCFVSISFIQGQLSLSMLVRFFLSSSIDHLRSSLDSSAVSSGDPGASFFGAAG